MFRKLLLSGGALVLLGAMSVSNAAVIVTLQDTAPTSNVFASFNGPSTANVAWLSTATTGTQRRNTGFAFYNESATILNGFGIYASIGDTGNIAADKGEVTIHIREHATLPTAALANAPSGSSVYKTYNAEIHIDSFTTLGIVDFNLGETDGFALKAGYYYTIQLQWNSPAVGQRLTVLYGDDPTGVAVGGWAGDGNTWTPYNTRDYLFYAYTAQAIPEPSTIALLGFAGAGFVFYRQRRKA